MNLSQLYYFKKLAEIRHYTKAAKELFITQPTLSDSIASLEEELGVSLFQKDKRTISLTRHGRDFYNYVCSSLNQLDTGIALIKEKTNFLSGSIEIGCIPTLLSEFLPEAIYDYKKDINNLVDFRIHNRHTEDIIKKIKSDELDLGFCSKMDGNDDLCFVPILYQPYVCIVSNKHPLAKQKSVKLADLKNYNILTYRQSLIIYKDIEEYLKKEELELTSAYDDEISIGGIVSIGDYVGIVAETVYLNLCNHLVHIPIVDIPLNAHTIYMVYKNKKYIAKNIESFANFIVSKKLHI